MCYSDRYDVDKSKIKELIDSHVLDSESMSLSVGKITEFIDMDVSKDQIVVRRDGKYGLLAKSKVQKYELYETNKLEETYSSYEPNEKNGKSRR